MSKIILSVILGTFVFSLHAMAAISPVGIAIVPPVQFPASDSSVTGLRTSILWGKHRSVYGFDFGVLGNITDQNFVGLGVSGIFNWTKGSTTIIGLQLAGITNINKQKTQVYGLQAALGVNYNEATSSVVGIQLSGIANISRHTNIYGLQVSAYNVAQEVYGLQIGVVNVAKNLHGFQIGLVNIHQEGLFKVSPILNFGF